MTGAGGAPLDRGVFVTGTDTGVGKTLVSAVLCRVLAGAVYVKPVQSGAADGDDDSTDVATLAGVPTMVGPVIGPSLAPGVAARLAGEELLLGELVDTVDRAREAYPGRPLVVEGAGGLLVELTSDGRTCADLAGELDLPIVVVARPGLGTLNHTALTVRELDRRGLDLAGIVVSGYPDEPDVATGTNLAELDRIADGRLAGVVPRLVAVDPDALAGSRHWLTPALGGDADPAAWRAT